MRHFAALLVILLGGCGGFEGITGSGKLVTKEISVSDFQRIEAGNSFNVDITQGDKTSVVITADDNVWEHLQIESHDGTLHLQTKPGSYSNVHLEAR
jgi:putative autotransporter adhesin-like protein